MFINKGDRTDLVVDLISVQSTLYNTFFLCLSCDSLADEISAFGRYTQVHCSYPNSRCRLSHCISNSYCADSIASANKLPKEPGFGGVVRFAVPRRLIWVTYFQMETPHSPTDVTLRSVELSFHLHEST